MKAFAHFYYYFSEFIKKLTRDNITLYAATTSFFIIICFFPFVIILFTIIQYTPITASVLTSFFRNLVPEPIMPIITSVINEIYGRSSTAFISITIIAMLWIAGKAFHDLLKGLNTVYEAEQKHGFFIQRLMASLYMLLFIVLIVFMLLSLVFSRSIIHLLSGNFPLASQMLSALLTHKHIIMFCILVCCFMFIYKYVPSRKSTLIKELPGAILVAIGWQLLSFAYSLYVNYSSGFANTYGSLATIVFAMLWLYYCMILVFIGAEFNMFLHKYYAVYLQNRKNRS